MPDTAPIISTGILTRSALAGKVALAYLDQASATVDALAKLIHG